MGAAEQNFTWIIKKPDLFYKSGFVYYLLNQKENRLAFASRFMLALRILPARAMYCPAVKKRACGPQGSAAGGGKSDRSGWAAACLGASKVKREGLAATRTVLGRKKAPIFRSRLMLALPIFPVSSKYCASFKSMPVACFRRKKLHPFGWSSLCWRYLSSRPVTRQVLSAKVCLTSVFGMGTGGPTPQSTPTF